MPRHNLGVSEWLQRLGIKGGDVPDVVPLIQPVQVVSDASALTSPLIAPVAWAGGVVAAGGVGEYASLTVQALASGGVWIRYLSLSAGAAVANPIWTIAATDPFAADPLATTATNRNMGPKDVQAIVRIGTSTVQLNADNPAMQASGLTFQTLPDLTFVPPGSWFAIQLQTANTEVTWAVCVQDAPDQVRGEA